MIANMRDLKKISSSFEPLSSQMDQTLLQESAPYRSLARAKLIADYLIDDDGVMDLALLEPLIQEIENNLYSLLPNHEMDAIFFKHQLNGVKTLRDDKEVRRLLFLIDKPENHKIAEEMVQRACGLESKAGLTKAHARRAALSAYLTLLRQNVGSCFATAPALLIQEEKPAYLLKDLSDLLATGRLKRVIAGIEYSVPLSSSLGIGDLRKQLFLTSGSDALLQKAALAPGLQLAFSAAEVKPHQIFPLLQETFREILQHYTTLNVSVEDLLKKALLKHLEITEKELEEYELRTKPHLPFGIIDWTPTGKGKSTGEKCASFFQLFDTAKKNFISLTDHPLLKAWEFTLASFCETQSDFAKWNLYSSLGMDPREPGGIGEILYRAISLHVERSNQKMLSIQDEYQTAYLQLQGVETKVKNATSETELRWIRADYLSKKNEFYTLEEMRNKESKRGHKLASLFQFIVDHLVELFPKYFQEVYDPDLKEVVTGPYDDAPAGFRLMYKHGRTNTAAWSFIRNYQEFIDTLSSFFNAFEVEYLREPDIAAVEKEFTDAVTQMSVHIRSEEFIQSAFDRMARHHKTAPVADPLHNLDKIPKKPWAYTSGGTMGTLIANYFSREEAPADSTIWVETTQELLLFLEDTMKKVPYKEAEKFLEKPCCSYLMHSPTHAFRFLPGLYPFNKAWQDRQYTYTFVRDKYVEPTKQFYNRIRLDTEMIRSLLQEIRLKLHAELTASFDLAFRMLPRSLSPQEFYSFFARSVHQDRTLGSLLDYFYPRSEVDSLLFANIPYVRRYHIEEKAMEILEPLCQHDPQLLYKTFGEVLPNAPEVMPSKDFLALLLEILQKVYQKSALNVPLRQTLLQAMQEKELRPPPPVVFADSNWMSDYFAFLVSPATHELELWRVTPFSVKGSPLSIWKPYLDGSVKHPPWGIYMDKRNYS